MTVTVFDRHIRLQKEHPARGGGHMVPPSAGVAPEQVTTLAQGHNGLRFVPSLSLVEIKTRRGEKKKKRWKWGGWAVVLSGFGHGVSYSISQ